MQLENFYAELDAKYNSGNPEVIYRFLSKVIEKNHLDDEFSEVYLSALNELGSLERGRGRYAESKKAFEDSEEIIKKFVGMDTLEYATNQNNLAGTLRLMGEYREALNLFEAARLIYEKKVGHVHFYTASTLNNEALIYIEIGENTKAKECLQEALDIMRLLKGDKEIEAITLVNLATVTKEKTYLLEALEIYMNLPNKGVHYGSAINMLASFYYEEGDYDSAEKYFELAKEEVKKVYGESKEYQQACKNLEFAQKMRKKI